MPKTKREVNNDFITFSKRLRELRESLDMTQKEFAEHVGFTQATLSAYENSLKIPSLDIVMRIASECKISIDWLCGLSNKKNRQNKIESYDDFIQSVIPIIENVASCIEYVNLDLFDRKLDKDSLSSNKYAIPALCFLDKKIASFFKEYMNIKKLLNNETIDKEMYDIWIEKSLRKYNSKIDTNGDYSVDTLVELPF